MKEWQERRPGCTYVLVSTDHLHTNLMNASLSGNASLIGILFLSAPHMFTLWGTLVAFMPDKMPAAML